MKNYSIAVKIFHILCYRKEKKGRVCYPRRKIVLRGKKRREKSLAHLKEKKKIGLERKSKLLLLKSEDEKES